MSGGCLIRFASRRFRWLPAWFPLNHHVTEVTLEGSTEDAERFADLLCERGAWHVEVNP